jgi:hypothetical protein
MVKQNAKGGFVVTTGMFTEHASQYAQNHNIELVDGMMLVRYWLKGKKESLKLYKRNLEPQVKLRGSFSLNAFISQKIETKPL